MAHQPTILVTQPDAALQALIVRVLKTASFRVLKAATASEALELHAAETVDAIIIDQWLPDQEALKVCAAIRETSSVPLLMVGATSDAYTRSVALDQGVDDYVVTPFEESEFLARVRALLRRSQGPVAPARSEAIRCGSLEISVAEHRITRHGQPVHLTKTEWALMKVFLEHHGQVLTHRMLLQQVWGKAYSDDRSYLHAYIRRLRSKLEDDPAHPRLINSESGIGYRFMRLEAAPANGSPAGSALAGPSEGSPAAVAGPRAPEGIRRQHLPLTSLIGRDHELAQIQALLASPDVRLVTLTGTGGAGKTCLAAHLAARLAADFSDGAVFVALDTIHDPARLPAALAWEVGIQDRSDNQPINQLIGWIDGRQILLVLDNFEQLLPAAPYVSQLLQGCPRLKILVTSRIPLGLYGEQEFSVPPLGLDDPQDLPSLERIAELPAIQLFVRRAQAVDPAFALTADNAAAIAEICRRLDRLPLAIELAAVQSKFYPPAAMLQRLSQRLDFLHHAGPDRTPRQHSLRGAIDWSYDLLPEYERTIFAGVAVFEGSFTREAAQALWPDNDPTRVERALQALVNASVLQREPSDDGLAWFAMLDTLREYALEKQPAAMADQIACHLLNYYVNLVVRAERSFLVANHSGWLDRLEREHATIRAVLDWGCRHAVWPAVWRLGAAIWRFWYEHGHINEGRAWLARIQAGPDAGVPLEVRDTVALGAGVLAFIQDDYPAAQAAFARVLEEPRTAHEGRLVAQALTNLGMVAYWQGRYAEAIRLLQESLPMLRRLDDRYGMASTLRYLGMAQLDQGSQRPALAMLADSLNFYQQLGNQSGIGTAMGFYGRALFACGDLEEAAYWLEQSIAILSALDNWPSLARSQTCLGRVALARNQPDRARALLRNSLRLFDRVGDREGIATALEGLALLKTSQGQFAQARDLWRGADSLRATIGAPIAPADRRAIQRLWPSYPGRTTQPLRREGDAAPEALPSLIARALADEEISKG